MTDTPANEPISDRAPESASPETADRPEVEHPAPPAGESLGNLDRMLDVPLDMTVELGRTQMALSEVLRLDTGSVVSIDRLPGEPIDLLINGRVFARGEVVVINDTFGFRVTELVDQSRSGTTPRARGG